MDSDLPAPTPCGCPQGRARIRLLDGALGVTFAISGLVVMGDVWELQERSVKDLQFRVGDKAQRLMVTEEHEYIHYLQAVGSSYLQWHAHEQLRAAFGLLHWGPSHRSYLEGYRELSGALSRPGAHGLSCLDILESGAVLEGYKMLRERWRKPINTDEAIQGFVSEVETYRANPGMRRYHVAYDWLEEQIGREAAYRLYAPLSFMAFTTDDPSSTFTDGGIRLARGRGRLARKLMTTARVSAVLESLRLGAPWMSDRSRLTKPPEEITAATEAAFHMVDVFGIEDALELLIWPWRLDRDKAPQWAIDAVAPLVLVWSSAAGLVEAQLSDLAAQDNAVLARVLEFCTMVGAAERISAVDSGNLSVHRPCPHTTCPAYGPALCHQFFFPPPLTRHHETCSFIESLDRAFGKSSGQIWADWGLPPEAATLPEP
jgi:hypothetical protein